MTNINTLENITCPDCGNEESFRIGTQTLATVTDDGVEDYGDMEWDHDSYAECTQCGKSGVLSDFYRNAADGDAAAPSGERHPFCEITEDEFNERYPLVENHLNPNAGWCLGDGRGCLFETYGEELDFVRRQDPRHVWTLIDGEDGDQHLTSGFHFVNRIGYLISTVAVPEGMGIQVHIRFEPDPEPEAREPIIHAPWSLRFERDGTENVAAISTALGRQIDVCELPHLSPISRLTS